MQVYAHIHKSKHMIECNDQNELGHAAFGMKFMSYGILDKDFIRKLKEEARSLETLKGP